MNKIGSYKCSCDEGYELENDDRTCKRTNKVKLMLVQYKFRMFLLFYLLKMVAKREIM